MSGPMIAPFSAPYRGTSIVYCAVNVRSAPPVLQIESERERRARNGVSLPIVFELHLNFVSCRDCRYEDLIHPGKGNRVRPLVEG